NDRCSCRRVEDCNEEEKGRRCGEQKHPSPRGGRDPDDQADSEEVAVLRERRKTSKRTDEIADVERGVLVLMSRDPRGVPARESTEGLRKTVSSLSDREEAGDHQHTF